MWSLQPARFPAGLTYRRTESGGERGCCQCFHSYPCRFLPFLCWNPWAMSVTLLYHPWIISPIFWGSLYWYESSGLLANVKGSEIPQDLRGFFTCQYEQCKEKLLLTSVSETYRNIPAHTSRAWKLPYFTTDGERTIFFVYAVNICSFSCILSHAVYLLQTQIWVRDFSKIQRRTYRFATDTNTWVLLQEFKTEQQKQSQG